MASTSPTTIRTSDYGVEWILQTIGLDLDIPIVHAGIHRRGGLVRIDRRSRHADAHLSVPPVPSIEDGVSVPVAPVMADAGTLLSSDGMLVFFVGIANGTMGPLDISRVYLDNAQFTGTSGSAIHDQAAVLDKAAAGTLSPSLNLAAIGGTDAGRQGIEAVLNGQFAGKVVIFPQMEGVPLTGLVDLADTLPDVAAALGAQGEWTDEAERILIENYAYSG